MKNIESLFIYFFYYIGKLKYGTLYKWTLKDFSFNFEDQTLPYPSYVCINYSNYIYLYIYVN